MLKPAIAYKEQLSKKFSEVIYDDEYFYYTGYPYNSEGANLDPSNNTMRFAILEDNAAEKQEVIGYLCYTVDPHIRSVASVGLYSFDPGNLQVIRDVYNHMVDLCGKFRRVEFRGIQGNHAIRGYRNFLKRITKIYPHAKTYYSELHDCTRDANGEFHDSCIFEIINVDGGNI